MNYQEQKDKILSYGGWFNDDTIADYINKNMNPENEIIYRKFLNDPDIKNKFGMRLNNIEKKIIWNNNIKMSNIEQATPVQGIIPSIVPQNSQDGPQPGTNYTSSKGPFVNMGMANNAGSNPTIIKSKSWSISRPVMYGIGIGVVAFIAYEFYKSEKKKSKKK